MFFYLILAVLLTTGQPATTYSYPYTSEADCNQAGVVFAAAVRADPDHIKQGAWFCQAIDFQQADPVRPPQLLPKQGA